MKYITAEYIINKTKQVLGCSITYKNNKYYVKPDYEDSFIATKEEMIYNLIEYLSQDINN